MYQNILTLLDNIKNNMLFYYQDFNIKDDHLKEFYSNHNSLFDIYLIKLYLMILNRKDDDIETIKYVANYTNNANYEYIYLIKQFIISDTLPLIKNIVLEINPKYEFIITSYKFRNSIYMEKDMLLKLWISDILLPFLITNIDKDRQIRKLENVCNQMTSKIKEMDEEINKIKYAPGGYEYNKALERFDSMKMS